MVEDSRISDETRQRILQQARLLNYIPNSAARKLRHGRSKISVIGFLINDITHPFYSLMVQAAEKTAARHGYEILVGDTQWNPAKEVAEVKHMIESRVDGVLACLSERTRESTGLLDGFAVPYLMLDTTPREYRGACVVNDLAEASRIAVSHLIQVGCRRLAFLAADESMAHFSAFTKLREEFARAVRARGLPFEPSQIIRAGLSIEAGQSAFEEALRVCPGVEGIFCVNTLCALGVIEAADRRGVRVGREVAVMGVDDLDICSLSRISLTTIRQPYDQLAELATEYLVGAIENGAAPTMRQSLKPELVARQSTRFGNR
ncbi:MAG TPA: LacI family DNA-binding transcriptional regulator [Candidatus Sumerlaeota bacterium]|nr:LacI family DNA-binding transcriptional regulator [Candidatus Sumerlaeota bacterium]HPK02209.1 LacI family DNA-binding transcriptional regulator [Candidatus Sumerlaeota bacterium]